MSKRILISIVVLTVALFVAMPFISTSHGKARHGKIDPAFKEFVSAFTSGYVSTDTKIRIVLQNPSPAASVKNTPIDNDLFDFSPGIDGKITWIDDNTVEFTPDQRLKQDQLYSVTFNLGKVCEVPSALRKFEFDFQTIPQAMDVQVENYVVKDKTDFKVLQVAGVLTTADVADNELVEKCLDAAQPGNSVKISWNHESPTQHRFVVDNVVRGKERSLLTLSYNGEPIQAKESSSVDVTIPAENEFIVMNVKVDHDPEQVVTLQCSDILQPGQNLEGLISIENNGSETNTSYYSNNPAETKNSFTYTISENEIKLFPAQRLAGTKNISIDQSVKNAKGKPFTEMQVFEVLFEELKPAIKVKGKGAILPGSEGLVFPFEAVNINAVDVRITKIYESNMLQFLQVNNLEGNRELNRVGKVVLKKKIPLNTIGALPKNKWTKYALDLSKLVDAEPGAIYNISMNFRQSYSIYNCDGDTSATAYNPALSASAEGETEIEDDEKDWDYYGNYYYDEYEGDYYDYYNYSERENPCTPSYYGNSRAVTKNILASSIGLMAKKGNDGSVLVVATDLISTKPLTGVTIEAYDFQQQLLDTKKTDGDGLVKMQFKKKPFVILARNGEERNYLKLDDGASNSLSTFEVNGDEVQKGLKGFIYGERGVWRPGDSLFISFILEDRQGTLPAQHPVSMELVNPMGQVVQKLTRSQNVDGFYDFRTKTDNYAPTGNYMAKVRVGGTAFTKNIRIETIMPNRLKLNLDFKTETLYAANGELKGDLQVNWLHGAPGRNLEAKIDMGLTPTTTEFKNYKGYIFDSPIASFASEPQTIFTGRTDEKGYTAVAAGITGTKGAPGVLSANFTVRAFEEGGAFSTDRFSLPLSPYSHYVGVKIPKPDENRSYLETDTDHKVDIVSVDEQGNPASRNINVKVYKMSWRWWWDSYSDDVSSYVGSDYRKPVYEENISTDGGKGSFRLRVNHPEWGRYLVYATDAESGHSSGTILYLDWPSWAGKSPKGNEGATMLNFTTDKGEYKVGETVKMSIPSTRQGRAFISIETGSRVLKTYWVKTEQGNTDFEFPVSGDMTPNVYIYTTLIQPHAQALNDMPIRMYGVVPIMVKDENTILKPVISCEDVWKPESTAMVKVSEDNGKEMAYTLAIVDDGLLDLTRFKTPDPWSAFYAKEALGVKTWDVYDMVIGATGSVLQRILSIGGDEGLDSKSGSNAQRFKPMVRFAGPFKLKKGETASHKINIPQYVGSVRVMVIAGEDGAYGKAEKTVKVRKPLMILSTLPRLLGPGEEVELPVTVFAMEKKVRNATITISPDKHFSAVEGTSRSVDFEDIGDKVVTFRLKVKDNPGVAKVKISASGAGETANEEIEIEVRTPNPMMTDVKDGTVEAGRTLSIDYKPLGIQGTNKAIVEISSMPPINLQKRLDYLIQYPHGCVEQTTSSVFAQLYLDDIMELSAAQKKTTEGNIKDAIKRLKLFQTPSGGLSYWPGLNTADEWGSNYAGHFLLEAEAKGYSLPYGLLDNWKKYQKDRAQNWIPTKNAVYYQEDLTQAYRLYTLALAKSADLGSMNRLKENKNLSLAARWRLAAAYVLAGQPETAKSMITNLSAKVKPYMEMAYTYGSSYRDEAMILETLTLLNMKNQAFESLKSVAAELSTDDWCSTQTTAYALIAVSKFVKANSLGSGISADCKIAGASTTVNTKSQIQQVTVSNANGNAPVSVSNKGKGLLYVRVIRSGIPAAGEETARQSNLQMSVNYKTLKGESLNVDQLEQGTDFIAEVTVYHPGIRQTYRNMALTQIFPGGWEIHNSRMDENISALAKGDVPTYQDIRDDRVYTYFDINQSGSRTYRVVLNAAYTGRFYLPTVIAEAMYDNNVTARMPGRWIEVVKAGVNQ